MYIYNIIITNPVVAASNIYTYYYSYCIPTICIIYIIIAERDLYNTRVSCCGAARPQRRTM